MKELSLLVNAPEGTVLQLSPGFQQAGVGAGAGGLPRAIKQLSEEHVAMDLTDHGHAAAHGSSGGGGGSSGSLGRTPPSSGNAAPGGHTQGGGGGLGGVGTPSMNLPPAVMLGYESLDPFEWAALVQQQQGQGQGGGGGRGVASPRS